MIIKDEEQIQKAGTVCNEDHKREGRSAFAKDTIENQQWLLPKSLI